MVYISLNENTQLKLLVSKSALFTVHWIFLFIISEAHMDALVAGKMIVIFLNNSDEEPYF